MMTLLSLSPEGVQLNKEGKIADDHFDVDYWKSTEDEEIPLLEGDPGMLTISALPSTTLGVTAIKLRNANYLLYDTPGICPSPYRTRLLSSMLAEEQKRVKQLFPRKKLIPTVFSLHPDHSILLGSLASIDYKAVDNVRIEIGLHEQTNPLVCYAYTPLPLHLAKTSRIPELLQKHAGTLFQPPYSPDQYLATGGVIHQSDFELKRVFNIPSEIKNTIEPNSPSSLKYTAFVDISVGGFGWIAMFTQGGDNTNKKYKQLQAGTLCFNAVKGFNVVQWTVHDVQIYPRPPFLSQIPEKMCKLSK